LILRFVGQKSSSHCPSTCSQLDFRTFGSLLIFDIFLSGVIMFFLTP